MLKVRDISIPKGVLNHLLNQQSKIDIITDYEQKVRLSKTLWQNKKKSNAQKSAFNRIEKELQKIAIGSSGYCNYCEANIGTNIEHVYPRGLFPGKTFLWDNYLWACKQCNGRHKVAQFAVFESLNSSKRIKLVKDYNFIPPPNDDTVFINPRVDNPMDYIKLDLQSGLFQIIEKNANSRAYKRAKYTLEVLQLNLREGLIEDRKKAIKNYFVLFQNYLKIQNADSLEVLKKCLTDTNYRLANVSLEFEKSRLSLLFQKSILSQKHLTVWKEMQRQAANLEVLKTMFDEFPEALKWSY
ncbi:MAG: hypothetical protein MK207_03700 [Saprospiraceae bacterium]|nr:hypothetical protein [Saprospiraceae bacterium]